MLQDLNIIEFKREIFHNILLIVTALLATGSLLRSRFSECSILKDNLQHVFFRFFDPLRSTSHIPQKFDSGDKSIPSAEQSSTSEYTWFQLKFQVHVSQSRCLAVSPSQPVYSNQPATILISADSFKWSTS